MGHMPKDLSIQTLRGLAIVMVVFLHITYASEVSLKAAAASAAWTSPINEIFWYVRMPLFTAISGWVYAQRPVRRDRVGDFLTGKARRILLPWLSLTFIHFLILHVQTRGLSHEGLGLIKHLLLYPYGHLWFLPALFLVILAICALERLGWMGDRRRGGCACAAPVPCRSSSPLTC